MDVDRAKEWVGFLGEELIPEIVQLVDPEMDRGADKAVDKIGHKPLRPKSSVICLTVVFFL